MDIITMSSDIAKISGSGSHAVKPNACKNGMVRINAWIDKVLQVLQACWC